jgi:hypothetical protein
MWKLWSKALGEKSSDKDYEADYVAILRTIIFTTYLITNMFIVAGVIRHWNDDECNCHHTKHLGYSKYKEGQSDW